MKTILVYLLQMIAASAILYGYYHIFLRNKKFHRYNRFYLLIVVIISIVIPFLNIPVYFSKETTDNSFVFQTLNAISSAESQEPIAASSFTKTASPYNWFNWMNMIYTFYFLVVLVSFIKILLSIRKIKIISTSYPSEKIGDIHFVNTNEPGTPFSFFRWLFWNREIELNSDKGQQIFRHELFHIDQRHTIDVFFMEFITAIAWFNPFFHLIKKELKTIHEFLADEYAMNKTENWQYAELLLMQALNTKLHLVNPFFHNQIKRRIAMITSSQKPGHQYLRKMLVLPVAAIIAALFAFSYKNKIIKDDSIVESKDPITVVIDAAHGGIDPGVKSPDGKYTEAELVLEISKTIDQLSKDHNIKVILTRDKDELPGNAHSKTDGLKKRIEVAKQYKPDAFISIHLDVDGVYNKYQNKSSGFQAYITNDNPSEQNTLLARTVLNELQPIYITETGIKQRQSKGIYVLDKNAFPALLLECGYMNNKSDLEFISNKENQEKIARAILNGVSRFANNNVSITQNNPVDTPKNKLPDTLAWIRAANTGSLKKIPPTTQQLKDWTNTAQYGVWIDAGKIKNSELSKYKPTDFSWYNVSKLYGAAKKNVTYNYQVSLYTKTYDKKTFSTPQKNTSKQLVFKDGVSLGYMFPNAIDQLPDEINFLSIYKGPAAISKFGEAGKDGVIEIFTKKYLAEHPEIKEKFQYNSLNKNNNLPLEEVVIMDNSVKDATPVFEKVEIEPTFPGGNQAWRKYLEKNLNALVPTNNGAKAGSYKVEIKFIVDKEGDITSINALTHHGYGMEEEVIRVIAQGPKWVPAKQNGHIVNAYKTQPVTFVIVDEVKDKKEPIITNSTKKE